MTFCWLIFDEVLGCWLIVMCATLEAVAESVIFCLLDRISSISYSVINYNYLMQGKHSLFHTESHKQCDRDLKKNHNKIDLLEKCQW